MPVARLSTRREVRACRRCGGRRRLGRGARPPARDAALPGDRGRAPRRRRAARCGGSRRRCGAPEPNGSGSSPRSSTGRSISPTPVSPWRCRRTRRLRRPWLCDSASRSTALVSHDPGTRLGSDPEDLHQLRVATRRLRAFLRAARPLLDPGPPRSSAPSWAGSAARSARRATSTSCSSTSRVSSRGLRGEAAAARAARRAQERRGAASGVLLEALSSERYFALLDASAAFRDDPPRSSRATRRWPRSGGSEAKRLRRPSRLSATNPADEALHAVRIRVKRARYAAELARTRARQARRAVLRAGRRRRRTCSARTRTPSSRKRRFGPGRSGRPELENVAARLVELERARRAEARAAWPAVWRLGTARLGRTALPRERRGESSCQAPERRRPRSRRHRRP